MKENSFETIWFKTGRLIPSEIRKGMPVFVLGTGDLALVAFGKTSSNVKRIPDSKEVSSEFQHEYQMPENRVSADIKRIQFL